MERHNGQRWVNLRRKPFKYFGSARNLATGQGSFRIIKDTEHERTIHYFQNGDPGLIDHERRT